MYFTSDTHFHHKNICKLANRPFASTEEMNEVLIFNWNSVVGPNDTIYHLGDFSFGIQVEMNNVLSRLNGIKHLILGNHDKGIRHNPKSYAKYFKSIQDYLELKNVYNEHFVLSHFAFRVWNKSHRGSINLYGHSHGNLPPIGRQIDVGVDCKLITDEYRPVHVNEIINYMTNIDIVNQDHHV